MLTGSDKIQAGSSLHYKYILFVLNKKHILFANDSQEQKIFIDVIQKKGDTILLLFFFVAAFAVTMCEEAGRNVSLDQYGVKHSRVGL